MNHWYDWPKHDDIDEVNMIHLISGPEVLAGTPCAVRVSDKAFADFEMFVKHRMM